MKIKLKLRPKIIVTISVIISIIMITSAYFELTESKKEIYRVLTEGASSIIETVSLSSVNTLNSSYEIEDLIAERLLDNARLIKKLDSLKVLTKNDLIHIGKVNQLFRINIFDKEGNRILSNRVPLPGHISPGGSINRSGELAPILNGKTKEIVLGLKESQHSDEQRFAVAVARSQGRGAIVINLNAAAFLNFRKKIGIGKIIQDIADNPGIEYIVLQDSIGILAASQSVKSISSIETDPFLHRALTNDSILTRESEFNGHDVFEVVKSLRMDNDLIGVYRIGLSLDEVKNVEARMIRRVIFISLLLAAISVIVLGIVFTSQNLKTVSNEFAKFKTFTGSILKNMGEAVIVVDTYFTITLFNKYAEALFGKKFEEVINLKLSSIIGGTLAFIIDEIEINRQVTFQISKEVELDGSVKFLVFSVTKNINESREIENYTIVIRDLTKTKALEEQAKRNEKLSAMGELASGVAHEIRNPINAIGMIAQRLNKEFTPEEDTEEYSKITRVLKDEVTRINKIITQFLNYARPLDLQLKDVDTKEYFEDIFNIYLEHAKEKNIAFKKESDFSRTIRIDPELMKQALMNIILNAFDAVGETGIVKLNYYQSEGCFCIEIADNGPGISEELQKKIFDLYFTTKNDGNGLGLSIAQKIIAQHNGTIEVRSKLNSGTTFIIKLIG